MPSKVSLEGIFKSQPTLDQVNLLSHPLFQSLSPVFIIIAAGYVLGRSAVISSKGIKDISTLVFYLLVPALLFRTMSNVNIHQLDIMPILAYFFAVLLVFSAGVYWLGHQIENVVLVLGSIFSNMVMVGIPLIGLAYGQEGLVTLLTLVAVHALILLTVGTVTLEVMIARKHQAKVSSANGLRTMIWRVIQSSVIHPIPLPIVCGLLFAQTGLALPIFIDVPLEMLGKAFGPLALVLVGLSLAQSRLTGVWRVALYVSFTKTVVLPCAVAAVAWFMGIRGLPFVVMVVVAGLPIGANVILFAQRYKVVQELTTASMGVSTVMAAITLSIIMLLVSWIPV